MNRWSDRTIEEASLANPAFLALLARQAVDGYAFESGTGMPIPLLFVALPLVLYSNVRTMLPSRIDSSLLSWLQAHPTIHLRFPTMASTTREVVQEGLLTGLCRELLTLEGALVAPHAGAVKRDKGGKRVSLGTDEMVAMSAKARFVGRWFAHAGTTETIMAVWGVRP